MGDVGMAIGFAISAAVVFFIKGWIDEEGDSSLLSIPTRFWPVLYLVFALFFVIP
jgi:hypothetical protein